MLQAADFGTPQSRKRLFLLGYRQDCPCPSYPSPRYTPRRTDGSLPEESLFPLGPSVSDALADLPDADIFEELLRGDSVASVEYSEPSPYAATLRGVTQDLRNYARLRPAVGNRLTASARTVHTQKSIDRFEATRPGTTEGISRFLRLHPEGICNTLRGYRLRPRGVHGAPSHSSFLSAGYHSTGSSTSARLPRLVQIPCDEVEWFPRNRKLRSGHARLCSGRRNSQSG